MVLAAAGVFAAPVWAQPAERELQFDIPAQPLDAALENYMQTTGLQVLYPSALVEARVSAGVRGRFMPARGLSTLLAGTGLAAHTTVDGAFTLRPAAGPVPRGVVTYEGWLGGAQHRIVAVLCRDAVTRPGRYRVAMQLSVGRSGAVDDAALLDTTGDPTRDRGIVTALHGLALGEAPPGDMPQPVTMLITPRPPGVADECRRFPQ